ncbi:hypothetical protein L4C36_12540 [Photobacterium japonica]|uniref:hypothetical protein n=1 Tax=Photobacterium japonica TaxID=2910235 RepID=UPI003D0CA52A
MRPASYARSSTPRSPSRFRTTSHAPTYKAKPQTATVAPLPTPVVAPVTTIPVQGEHAA